MQILSQESWFMPVIPTFGNRKQEDQEFEASYDDVKPCLKSNRQIARSYGKCLLQYSCILNTPMRKGICLWANINIINYKGS